eukprot:CAMPEP_0184203360 /NCGR_PEP_ID=MMETSP0976-20121227/9016_1 /TAXON_ID=483370 /ORGANISM="non described non described, Strain CCMP2097" /LENGTH=36 /DNA_ID= /DNA_START= /DNA_END= /DNA_ORIENTATION=
MSRLMLSAVTCSSSCAQPMRESDADTSRCDRDGLGS